MSVSTYSPYGGFHTNQSFTTPAVYVPCKYPSRTKGRESLFRTAEQEEQRIRNALREVGVEVSTVYDLVNSRKQYPMAIPVLLEFLQQGISDDRIKEGVIRALSVKQAKTASLPLLQEFRMLPVPRGV